MSRRTSGLLPAVVSAALVAAIAGAGGEPTRALEPDRHLPASNTQGSDPRGFLTRGSADCYTPLPGGATAVVEAGAPPQAGEPIWGFADLHSHQFSYLGFGGVLVHGKAYDDDSDPETALRRALPRCDFRHTGPINTSIVDRFGLYAPPLPIPFGFPDFLGVPLHGAFGGLAFGIDPVSIALTFSMGDPIGNILSGKGLGGHNVHGTESFNGWPRWNDYNHQQWYADWISRAFQGGLRLMVMLAVDNEVLCRATPWRRAGFACNDMQSVDRQLAEALAFEQLIDERAGGPGQGWYRIVRSAAEARDAINSGKLAVVLGIEVANLFGCNDGTCTEAYVESELQRYYDMGVRHIFPVHVYDNDFGGTSLSKDFVNVGNALVSGGNYFDVRNCADLGVDFQFDLPSGPWLGLLTYLITDPLVAAAIGTFLPPSYPDFPHCNTRGLTALGEFLIREMIERRMILDVDHLSALAIDHRGGAGLSSRHRRTRRLHRHDGASAARTRSWRAHRVPPHGSADRTPPAAQRAHRPDSTRQPCGRHADLRRRGHAACQPREPCAQRLRDVLEGIRANLPVRGGPDGPGRRRRLRQRLQRLRGPSRAPLRRRCLRRRAELPVHGSLHGPHHG